MCFRYLFNWEAGHSQPDLRYMPGIVTFLGYNPLPEATTLAERQVRRRTTIGMSQEEASVEIGVDQGTLARWERGEKEPAGAMLDSAMGFLASDRGQQMRVPRAG